MNQVVLIRRAEVRGTLADVLVRDGVVAEIGDIGRVPVDEVVEANGGALIPGLHDHHTHLLAAAAADASIIWRGAEDLIHRLTENASRSTNWIRVVGLDSEESLDRFALDAIESTRPMKVQHRSGALWILNSAALELLRIDPAEEGVDVAADGQPSGRIWRRDDLVVDRGQNGPFPDLTGVGQRLSAFGVTGVTDASPDLDRSAQTHLAGAVTEAILPVHLQLLTAEPEPDVLGPVTTGPRKIVISDHSLPDHDHLVDVIRGSHAADRSVAAHVVTREALLLFLAALDTAGPMRGDRLEHAAVVPTESIPWIADLGLSVVTQPGFLHQHGDRYLAEVDSDDVPLLYPYAMLLDVGIRTAPSSDGPYGPMDPWQVIAAAATRQSAKGLSVGSDHPIEPAVALAGYLSPLTDPGGPARRITVGGAADLCLLHVPLREALAAPDSANVHRTWWSGP